MITIAAFSKTLLSRLVQVKATMAYLEKRMTGSMSIRLRPYAYAAFQLRVFVAKFAQRTQKQMLRAARNEATVNIVCC